ncbi:hypothetical protein BKA56DRAFT_681459 [Ilyonectria sp. MPI-CAGE-AT-0026]|nr:hypothetical protein BKA56DRAFT_681459 [Ilyonectria sp. MPI-CAGE-AT-0026]
MDEPLMLVLRKIALVLVLNRYVARQGRQSEPVKFTAGRNGFIDEESNEPFLYHCGRIPFGIRHLVDNVRDDPRLETLAVELHLDVSAATEDDVSITVDISNVTGPTEFAIALVVYLGAQCSIIVAVITRKQLLAPQTDFAVNEWRGKVPRFVQDDDLASGNGLPMQHTSFDKVISVRVLVISQ